MALEDYMLPCLNKKLFGVECFGCGMQRSVAFLFQGKFAEAWNLFPAVYPLMFLIAFLALNILDSKRNYSIFIIISALLMAVTMVASYFLKHAATL